jgi:hypothetical protein
MPFSLDHWQDTGADRIGAGQEAELLLARLRPYLRRQREQAVAQLISHHRGGSLTDDLMRSGIATLAALDTLEKDLGQLIRLGQKDQQETQRPVDTP